MNPRKLIIRSLLYFYKRNLLLSLGIAISTAVLTGALIVGDSVKHSLGQIVGKRLGAITHTMQSGDRYFTVDLAEKISDQNNIPVSSILLLDGIAVADGGEQRLNNIQVVGVDSLFDVMAGQDGFYKRLSGDSVYISSNLAERLNLEQGDEFLLRMTRASLVPLNAPFVSDAENTVSLRVTVKDFATTEKLGRFNLKNSQTAPYNIFIAADRLSELMELGRRANLMLFADRAISPGQISEMIDDAWTVADIGLNFRFLPQQALVEIKSDRVFIDESIADLIRVTNPTAQPILTYFVNEIAFDDRSTPYSFVSTLPDTLLDREGIVVNDWLADDIGVSTGDTITVTYYAIGPLRDLETKEHAFVVRKVVPITGMYGDRNLMPDIPGLSDAGNCRDWDTGVPISLESIRDKDEDYWTKYKGTPKAFIPASVAEKIWENRFGKYTSFRMNTGIEQLPGMQRALMKALSPHEVGFRASATLERASSAAAGGVDFSQLFGGLSFFLLAGAVLLSVLLFRLNLDERREQVITLTSIGIPAKTVYRILIAEGMVVAAVGSLTGVGLAILYNKIVFLALNSIWMDIVRTEMLVTHIKILTLILGLILSLTIAWIALIIPLKRFLRKLGERHVQKMSTGLPPAYRRLMGWLMLFFTVLATVLMIVQFIKGETVNAGIFFAAGGLLLVAGLLFSYRTLVSVQTAGRFVKDLTTLGLKNTLRNATRSITIIVLFAIGTFLVISTGSNRKDLFINAGDLSSGTGGFLYYAESTAPVLQNLSNEEVRYNFGLGEDYDIIQMRVADGDDASCLNLNRIENPRILGVKPEKLSDRFSFVTATPELKRENPWSTLDINLAGGLIPAIADETVIKWGLGLKVGDTLHYEDAKGNEMSLLLTGGMAPSIFQGSVIISERHFLERFPENSGTEVFLVEGNIQDTLMIREELSMGMRDFGWTMEYAPRRLAEFNTVTNTYLSIFMVMGALGLLLGTVGLSIVLFRSVIERREELMLLRALGFGKRKINGMVIREYMLLLSAGTLIGAVAAVVATLPALLSRHSDVSVTSVLIIILALLVNGLLWIWWVTRISLRTKLISTALRNE
jgi:putative ABC transport system permease protein